MRRVGFGDFRKRDTEDTWTEQEVEGEIVDPKLARQKEAPTVKEIRFAKLVSKGEDPVKAAQQVAPIRKGDLSKNARMAREKKANEMLKICQDKMLLNISTLAPKGLKKLEELLEAKKEVLDKHGDIIELKDNQVQLKSATKLVDLGMPDEKTKGHQSLIGAVITIINE